MGPREKAHDHLHLPALLIDGCVERMGNRRRMRLELTAVSTAGLERSTLLADDAAFAAGAIASYVERRNVAEVYLDPWQTAALMLELNRQLEERGSSAVIVDAPRVRDLWCVLNNPREAQG